MRTQTVYRVAVAVLMLGMAMGQARAQDETLFLACVANLANTSWTPMRN